MRCDMCGAEGARAEDFEEVHRIYLLPAHQRLEEVERWCASCRSQYPHAPAPYQGSSL